MSSLSTQLVRPSSPQAQLTGLFKAPYTLKQFTQFGVQQRIASINLLSPTKAELIREDEQRIFVSLNAGTLPKDFPDRATEVLDQIFFKVIQYDDGSYDLRTADKGLMGGANGRGRLVKALKTNDLELAREAIKAGADVNDSFRAPVGPFEIVYHCSYLDWTIESKYTEIAALLIDNGAYVFDKHLRSIFDSSNESFKNKLSSALLNKTGTLTETLKSYFIHSNVDGILPLLKESFFENHDFFQTLCDMPRDKLSDSSLIKAFERFKEFSSYSNLSTTFQNLSTQNRPPAVLLSFLKLSVINPQFPSIYRDALNKGIDASDLTAVISAGKFRQDMLDQMLLTVCSENPSKEVVKALLEAGADPSAVLNNDEIEIDGPINLLLESELKKIISSKVSPEAATQERNKMIDRITRILSGSIKLNETQNIELAKAIVQGFWDVDLMRRFVYYPEIAHRESLGLSKYISEQLKPYIKPDGTFIPQHIKGAVDDALNLWKIAKEDMKKKAIEARKAAKSESNSQIASLQKQLSEAQLAVSSHERRLSVAQSTISSQERQLRSSSQASQHPSREAPARSSATPQNSIGDVMAQTAVRAVATELTKDVFGFLVNQ